MKNLELFNTFEKQNSFFQSEIALTSALTTYLRKKISTPDWKT